MKQEPHIIVEVQGGCVIAGDSNLKNMHVEVLDQDDLNDSQAGEDAKSELERLEKAADKMYGVL